MRLSASERTLQLLPLPPGTARGALAPSAIAAIVVAPRTGARQRPHQAVAGQLTRTFGLTRAEAAVALEVAKGDGRAAAASRLGLSENTVRSHLSAIFLKLGVERQAQLVRVIEGLAG